MDERPKAGLFGGMYGKQLPPGTGNISPYASIDPSLFMTPQPQYIIPEGNAPHRGRLELSFCIIGGAVLAGGSLGAASYMLKNPPWSRSVLSSRSRMSEYVTHVGKYTSSSAQRWGTAAFLYSAYVVLVSQARRQARMDDDAWNTLAAAALAGATFYYPSGGPRKALYGALLGTAFAGIYTAFTDKDRVLHRLGLR